MGKLHPSLVNMCTRARCNKQTETMPRRPLDVFKTGLLGNTQRRSTGRQALPSLNCYANLQGGRRDEETIVQERRCYYTAFSRLSVTRKQTAS